MMSLGCAKNLVDAEIMLGSLLESGHQITNDPTTADVLIVNTCSFIDAAQEESVDAILETAAKREKTRPEQGLIVSGCLPQRFGKELSKLMPEVDAFMGIDQVENVADIVSNAFRHREQILSNPSPEGRGKKLSKHKIKKVIETDSKVPGLNPNVESPTTLYDVHARPVYIPDYSTPRFRLTPHHSAYVKIAEGCNHPCSFCIIPRMRGSHRSRQEADVVREVRTLVEDGVKEINLISQDSTYYGMDLASDHRRSISSPERFKSANAALAPGSSTLSSLLRALNAIEGDFWIRILYTHPAHWTDELIETIATCSRVAKYVDIPLQHIHEDMLERMRRETTRGYIEDLIRRIRKGIPGIALRTTFIVGFPGETQASFKSLLQFIRDTRFERMGVFTYSHEDGTRAAKMEGQVSENVKQKRRNEAMAAQLEISRELSAAMVGKTIRVLAEKNADADELEMGQVHSWEHGLLRGGEAVVESTGMDTIVARSEHDAPDIDGRIYVKGSLPLGQFSTVKVVDHTDYDLIAIPS